MEHRDLMNETLLKAYQKFDTLKSKEAFLSFLFSISVRILANAHRKKKEEVKLDKLAFEVGDKSANVEKDMEVYLLYKALSMLPEERRECLILFEISGFSIREIAEIQKTTESNVKQRLRRGRIRLKEILSFESQAITEKKVL